MVKKSQPAPGAVSAKKKAPSSKTAPKDKAESKVKSKSKGPRTSALENIQETIHNVAEAITDAVDVAGDLMLDDPTRTPVAADEVLKDNVDVKKLKGKAAKAAKAGQEGAAASAKVAGKKAAEVEAALEEKLQAKGVDVKGSKKKAGKALKDAEEMVEKAAEASEPAVKKGRKAAKAAGKAAGEVEKEAEALVEELKDPNSKKRKRAEDFMSTAEGTARAVAEKVGEALYHVVENFGEASGLSKDLGGEKAGAAKGGKVTKAKDGKKEQERPTKKAKSTAEAVTEAADPVIKKGKKVAADVAAAAEPAAKKGKRAAAEAVEAAQPAVKKGKKAAAAAVEEAQVKGKKATGSAVKAGKKAAQAAAEGLGEEELVDGFATSDGEDSSDDESDIELEGEEVDLRKLPMVAKDDKSVAARLKKAQKKKDQPKGTLYLGRIPHGFYEEQMKEYFSQFGDVSRVRLARNKKTGASKHFGYIEMSSESVAEIVAETMNNYLLMGHLLKCQVIPQDDVHPKLWVGANRKFKKVPRARVEKMKHEKTRTKEQQDKADAKLLEKQDKRRAKIKSKGIDYEFEGHA